ncbi:MAG TPA: DUF2231 domain-containing protein [Castellaniella sp.]|uniref:DUF2231 domain-containing protein n=1 Tax=Castellaniella sp. TaxID=1955812 RepID=UPI002EEA549F
MRHPLHPALVHFPIACWTLATGTDFASLWLGEASWQWSAGLLAIGCIVALAAMTAGLVELARVPDGPALRDTYLHMGLMLAAFTFFTARLMLGLNHLQPLAPSVLSFVLDALGFITLATGGWLGGRLVYGHGIGR